MHYSQNQDTLIYLRVQNPVRKSSQQCTSDFPLKYHPSTRIRNGALDRRIHFNREILSKPWLYILVVLNGIRELCLGGRMKPTFLTFFKAKKGI